MKNKIFKVIIFLISLSPVTAFAANNDSAQDKIISVTEKYYKTITNIVGGNKFVNSANVYSNYNVITSTEEITEEEYNAYNASSTNITDSISTMSGSIDSVSETTYKKMTTTISKNGSYYRYKVVLNWKNMPKVRSYDVIAIGHYASVEINSSLTFTQKYCTSINSCKTSTSFTSKISDTGSGAVFKLPTGDFVSLSQTLYFDVKKALDTTVIRQEAVGDYAHAIKSISKENASKFSINLNGISFNSTSISNSFDTINSSVASWTGSW